MSKKKMTAKQWLAIRKEAARKIDPKTAEIFGTYIQTLCPEGTLGELPAECDQFAREYFVRRPRSNIWVSIGALPKPTRTALWKKRIKNSL